MMETKEIFPKLHQFVNEVSLGYKGEIDLNLLREAADRLEELEKQNEAMMKELCGKEDLVREAEGRVQELEIQLGRQQPEWIRVEDRLPEANKNYLIYTHLDRVNTAYFLRESEWINGGVTHWMPLPEPPKPKEPTFKDVFLEAFPNARKYDEGTPIACAENVFPQVNRCDQCDGRCDKCWNLPYFEEEGEGE